MAGLLTGGLGSGVIITGGLGFAGPTTEPLMSLSALTPPVLCTPRENFSTTLAADHTIHSGTIAVAGVSGLGSPSPSNPGRLTAFRGPDPGGVAGYARVHYKVTGVSGNVLTVTPIDGDSDIALLAGDVVWDGVASGYVADLNAAVLGSVAAINAIVPVANAIPAGGTTGQVLAKSSGTDYAAGWITPSSGGGAVTLTGNVTGTGTGTVSTTIGAGVVTASMLAGSIPASKLVGSDISIGESQVTNLTADLAAKAADNAVVHLTGPETIAGAKTFSSAIVGSISGNAGTVTSGVYTTGTYADPSWLTSLAGSKVTGNIAGNAAGLTANILESQVTGLPADLAARLTTTNNLSDLASAATARSNLGVALALTWTPVKTANYSGAAGECVPVDTTSGAVTVTLPTAPANKTPFAVKHIIQGASNAVTYQCGGSDVFNKAGGSTSGTLPLVNQGVVLVYDSARSVWGIVADDITLSSLDARFATAAQGSLAATAVQPAALSSYATLASPTFTGTVTLPVGLTGLAKLTSGVVSAATAGTDYVLPGGVSGGQTLKGGTANADNLTLLANSGTNAGKVYLNGASGTYADSSGYLYFPEPRLYQNATLTLRIITGSGAWADSVSTCFFQLVGSGTAGMFTGLNGSDLARFGVCATKVSFGTNSASLAAPTAFAEFANPTASQSAIAIRGAASQSSPLVALRQLSSTSTARNAGIIDATLATSTDASWKGRLVLYAGDFTSTNAGQREGVRVESDGTQPLLSFYGVTAVARQAVSGTATGTDATLLNALVAALKATGIIS